MKPKDRLIVDPDEIARRLAASEILTPREYALLGSMLAEERGAQRRAAYRARKTGQESDYSPDRREGPEWDVIRRKLGLC